MVARHDEDRHAPLGDLAQRLERLIRETREKKDPNVQRHLGNWRIRYVFGRARDTERRSDNFANQTLLIGVTLNER